jgi:hypothetical protein
MNISQLQDLIGNLNKLESTINSRLTFIIENIYSEYKPNLVPLADGEVKDGAVDTGEMARKSKFTIEFDVNDLLSGKTPVVNFVLDTTEYFKFVDGRNLAVPNGTYKMEPREFLSILLADPIVEKAVEETFSTMLVNIFENGGDDLISDEQIGFDIIGSII